MGMARIHPRHRRRADGDRRDLERPGFGSVHFLSALNRQSVFLFRTRAGRRRVMDMVRLNDRRDATMEERQSRRPGSSRDVRHRRHWCCSSCSRPMGGQSPGFSRSSRRRRSSTSSTVEGEMPSQLHATDRPWQVWSAAIIVLFVAAAALLGFIVLPIVQGRSAGLDAFAAICSRRIPYFPTWPGNPRSRSISSCMTSRMAPVLMS
jgi:hypothetical protein